MFVERHRERHDGDPGTHSGCGGMLYRLLPLKRVDHDKARAEGFDRALDSIGRRTGLLDTAVELLATLEAAGLLGPGECERLGRIQQARAQLQLPDEASEDLTRVLRAAMQAGGEVGDDGAVPGA